jgi:hypothetical protein
LGRIRRQDLSASVAGQMNKLPATNRTCKDFFRRPSPTGATSQKIVTHASFFRPLGKIQFLPVVFNNMISARIVSLFLICCPSAIVWKISQSVVYSLYTVLGTWTIADIGKKLFEAILPFLANSNSATTVTSIGFVSDTAATVNNSKPNTIFNCIAQAVTSSLVSSHISAKATATTGVARCHVMRKGNDTIAAITLAKPARNFALLFAYPAKHAQASKPLTRQVFNMLAWYWHNRRKIVRDNCKKWQLWGIVVVHENLHFSCQARGDSQSSPGIFAFTTPSIIAQLRGFWRVNSLTAREAK